MIISAINLQFISILYFFIFISFIHEKKDNDNNQQNNGNRTITATIYQIQLNYLVRPPPTTTHRSRHVSHTSTLRYALPPIPYKVAQTV